MLYLVRMVDRAIRALGMAAIWISALAATIIAVLGTADVISSTAFNRPIAGTFELSGTLLAVMIFLGLAHAQRLNEHVAVDILVAGAPRPWRTASMLLSLLLGAGVFAMMTWRGLDLAMASLRIREVATGQLRFPVYPAKMTMVFGTGVATLECLRQIVRILAGVPDTIERPLEERG